MELEYRKRGKKKQKMFTVHNTPMGHNNVQRPGVETRGGDLP